MVSAAGAFVYTKFSEILLFLPLSVIILLAFLSCLLVFFFFVKDQIASFQLKQIIRVFELCVPCVCLFHCVIATEFDNRI